MVMHPVNVHSIHRISFSSTCIKANALNLNAKMFLFSNIVFRFRSMPQQTMKETFPQLTTSDKVSASKYCLLFSFLAVNALRTNALPIVEHFIKGARNFLLPYLSLFISAERQSSPVKLPKSV